MKLFKYLTLLIAFLSPSMHASNDQKDEEIGQRIASRMTVTHTLTDKQIEELVPLYQDYYHKRGTKTADEIKASFEKVRESDMYRVFIGTVDDKIVAWTNVAWMLDVFNGLDSEYLARLDSAYVVPEFEGVKLDKATKIVIYAPLFKAVADLCKTKKTAYLMADLSLPDFEEEDQLFQSQMELFGTGKRFLDKDPKKEVLKKFYAKMLD